MISEKINCLVRVNGNNAADFNEWLEYHIALGFDGIFVFDTGMRTWLEGVCDKYRGLVVLVPREDWRLKRTIINSYSRRRQAPEWFISLDDDEYLWLDMKNYKNVRELLTKYGNDALSIYVKYLSSEKPMRNRVGTMIDCFTHSRPDPQGFVAPNAMTPNTAVTFVKITKEWLRTKSIDLMVNPITPSATRWIDTSGMHMNYGRISAYLGSKTYSPVSFPVRCYKYALKSGIEMEFKEGTCPSGYAVSDLSMQEARARLLRIPVNPETETLFAKSDSALSADTVVVREPSADLKSELMLPITAGKIDEMILGGKYFEDVVEFLNNKNASFDSDVLAKVFNREREMIISSSGIYRKLYELINAGVNDMDILHELKVSKMSLARMKNCLTVLDIAGYDEEKAAAAAADRQVMAAEAEKIVAADNMKELTAAFEESVSATKMTAEEHAEFEAIETEKKAKKKASSKKSRAKKKKADAETQAVLDSQPEVKPEEPVLPKDTGANDDPDSTDLLANVDLSAFMDK